jgi:small subunit ribosomal protein S9
VSFNVVGCGESCQSGAVRHGISRAILVIVAAMRPTLKEKGFLTRDARKKERKKPGQPGARKRFQYSKR